MSYRTPPQWQWRRWNWREVFTPQTPQGRFAILMGLLLILWIISLGRSISQSDGVSSTVALYGGRILALLLGFTLHEWAHAYTAFRLGGYRALPDPQRLSLNPLVHLDPIGTFLAVLLGFGWAKSVPVYPNALYPNEWRNMMLIAVAGPAMNLLIALVLGILLQLLLLAGVLQEASLLENVVRGNGQLAHFIYQLLAVMCFFNIFLAFFNLLPFAPLDGWRVMLGLLPNEQSIVVARYERESNLFLFFLLIVGFFMGIPLIGRLLGPLANSVFELFTGFRYLL
jgi:Zn-dependent protease